MAKRSNLSLDQFQELCQDFDVLERRLAAAGLHVTKHAINRAKNAAGYEYSGDIMAAAKAAEKEPI